MKKFLARPGFEAMFYTGLLLLIVLPAVVFAQQGKSLSIVVRNNDTIINGKKISELKLSEKKEAQEALAQLGTNRAMGAGQIFQFRNGTPGDSVKKGTLFSYSRTGGLPAGVTGIRGVPPGGTPGSQYYFYSDSANTKGARGYSERRLTYEAPDHMPTVHPDMRGFRMPVARPHENNDVITLDYNSTDKNGIPTRSNFRVSAAMPDMVKKLAGSLPPDLAVVDIALVPEFSTGKTLLVFTLPFATQADISFTNSDGQTLWSEKSAGNKFNKSFLLPLNGVYYLVVKQGGKAAVRKVVKE